MRSVLDKLDENLVVVRSGKEALKQLLINEFALVLLDVNMPVMDGLELVHAVRQHEGWRGVALMMVTTEGEKAQLVRALAAGADEYVVKPFTPDAIAEKLLLLGVGA